MILMVNKYLEKGDECVFTILMIMHYSYINSYLCPLFGRGVYKPLHNDVKCTTYNETNNELRWKKYVKLL